MGSFYSIRYKPRQGVYTIGKWGKNKAKWQINNFGWLNSNNYNKIKKQSRIALIGDSYVEALQVNQKETFYECLNEQLRNSQEVYSMGVSGAPLSQYLQMAKYAQYHFQPDMFIINLVHNDF